MFFGYDPELAALLSAEVDPQRAGTPAGGVSVWARVQGLLLLATAVGAGCLMVMS